MASHRAVRDERFLADYERERVKRGVAYGECFCGCGGRTALAKKNSAGCGWVKGQPKRFLPSHYAKTLVGFVGSKNAHYIVQDTGYTSPCWVWQGGTTRGGYGIATNSEFRGRVHRYVYQQRHGNLPAGVDLHHLCEVPPCCNPDHLRPLSASEHLALHRSESWYDTQKRRRLESPLPEWVSEVRRLHATGEYTQARLGEMFGVTQANISSIVLRKTWRRP